MKRTALQQRLAVTAFVFVALLTAWVSLTIAGKADDAAYLISGLTIASAVLFDQLGARHLQRTGRQSFFGHDDDEPPTNPAGKRPPSKRVRTPMTRPTVADVDDALSRREHTRAHRLAEEMDDPFQVARVREARERFRKAKDRQGGTEDR